MFSVKCSLTSSASSAVILSKLFFHTSRTFLSLFCEQVKTKQNATELQKSNKLLLANVCVTYSPTIPNLDFVSLKKRADLSVAEKLKETMFASL